MSYSNVILQRLSLLDIVRYLLYSVPFTLLLIAFFHQPPLLPPKTPKPVREGYPILGALRFFTARWDFFRTAIASSSTGNFSFHLGKHAVVGLSGDTGRQVFFNTPGLGFNEGYAVLFGQSPQVSRDEVDPGGDPFSRLFGKRLTYLLRRETLAKSLARLVEDTNAQLDALAKLPTRITDPYESIYGTVYQLTMRMVGCNEIANDPELLKKTLHHFETIESSATATTIIFPWLPSPALIKRTIAGAKLYMIFQRIVNNRKKTARTEDDPLQHLIDSGDDMQSIIAFVVGALFAGQLNSGINAAYVLACLGLDPYWMAKVREEVDAVLRRYSGDQNAPIEERLLAIPLEAWETEFEILDLCLKDSIRLQLLGTAFRRNISGGGIKVGDEVIPNGAFVTYHTADVHHDPNVYPNPSKWDPGRYLPSRAEDKKVQYGWLGWGAGRHPCLGMKFAKLEQNVIVAAFVSKFNYHVCDDKGVVLEKLPEVDINGYSACKPKERVFFKYELR